MQTLAAVLHRPGRPGLLGGARVPVRGVARGQRVSARRIQARGCSRGLAGLFRGRQVNALLLRHSRFKRQARPHRARLFMFVLIGVLKC